MTRVSASEARAILQFELDRAGWPALSAMTIETGARPGTANLEWWHERTPDSESSDTKRNLAYLRAYSRIGGERLYAGGLFLSRKRLWMDRSVISRLERDRYLKFCGKDKTEPWFELTQKGQDWIAGSDT